MSLSEQDEADLLGLLSGFGDAASRSRADGLVTSKPEAADYLRQMRKVTDALRPADGMAGQRLSNTEATAIVDAILKRASDRVATKKRLKWVPRIMAIAAVVGLMAGTSIWLQMAKHQTGDLVVVGRAILLSGGGQLSNIGDQELEIRAGTHLIGRGASTAMEFKNGNLAAVAPMTDLTVIDDGRHIELNRGEVCVAISNALVIKAPNVMVELKGGKASLLILETSFAFKQFLGTADLAVNGQTVSLAAGQQATWNENDRSLSVEAFDPQWPPWAERTIAALRDQ